MLSRIVLALVAILALCAWPSINLGGGGGGEGAPQCTVVADGAWSLNIQRDGDIFADTKLFDNSGADGTAEFFCGPTQHSVPCPTFVLDDGPFGSGAVWFDDPGATNFPELRSNYQAGPQDCSDAGELTVAFHIKPMTDQTTYGAIGFFRTHAVVRDGVFFSGINNGFAGPNDDRICMNIAGVDNLSGISDGPVGCGDVSGFGNWGKGANTENNPGDGLGTNLQFETWTHVALTFADENHVGDPVGGNDGRSRVYVDGVLVNSLDSAIDGLMPNTTNRWIIGASITPDITTYMIANLQIECVEWTEARVNQANECDVPN